MLRENNRSYQSLRKISLERHFAKYAEGSCLITQGNTKVLATVTVENSVPMFLRGTDTGWLTAEYGMLPRSCPVRVPRDKISGRTQEIQRLIGRSLRAVVDMDLLGEKTLKVDCDVIQADGGTRTAAITASFVAVVDALNKIKRSGGFSKIPIKGFLAAVSVGKVGGEVLLDLSYEEDSKAQVDMNVVMTGSGELVEVQATAESGTFSRTEMDSLLDTAEKGIEELVELQKKALGDVF